MVFASAGVGFSSAARTGGGTSETTMTDARLMSLGFIFRYLSFSLELSGRAASHDSRAAQIALRLDVEIQQLRAIGRELVNARCWRAAQDAAAVAAHLAIAEIVHQNESDVRLFAFCRWGALAQHRA